MREVFLSHASQDQRKAEWLRSLLLAHGVPVWFSPHHIGGAQQWQDQIGAALQRCGWFVILLTPHSVKSMWVKRELKFALIEKRYEKRIVPLYFQTCDAKALSWTLPQFQWIDFRTDHRQAAVRLLRVWKKSLRAEHLRRMGPP